MGPAAARRHSVALDTQSTPSNGKTREFSMIRFLAPLLLLLFSGSTFGADAAAPKILLVVGSGGTETYATEFAEIAGLWSAAASRAGAAIDVIGLDEPAADAPSDAERLRTALAGETAPELWLVLVGHGTYDQREVKFNLRGPDVTDRELASWLDGYEGSLCVVNTASASGSFVRVLARPDRVVVTATKNEAEVSYTRFGRHFAEAVGGLPEADLDNDGQVSLLEAFLHASKRVAEFYRNEGRVATEHALLDDNGDGLGSRAEWFEGTTPTRSPGPEVEPDGDLAARKVLVRSDFEKRLTRSQRERRDALEIEIARLRRSRDDLGEEPYYEQLEALLLDLARLYDELGAEGS